MDQDELDQFTGEYAIGPTGTKLFEVIYHLFNEIRLGRMAKPLIQKVIGI